MPDINFTTFDLPNYVGNLFLKGSRPNTILQIIGAVQGERGIGGYETITSTEFEIGVTYSIPDHKTQPAVLEGAQAPDSTGLQRAQSTNVVQIWHEKVKVTYTKEAARQLLSGLNNGGENVVVSELDFQTAARMEFIARRLNWTCINGLYQKPADNTNGRKTRGLLAAITTNVLDAAAATLSETMLEEALMKLINAGAIADGDNVVCLANTAQLRKINALYKTAFNQGQDRSVGGVRIREVYTAFGLIRFVLEQDMPDNVLVFANLDAVSLKALPVPGKGVLFRELLAKSGSAEEYQIYGEIGLDHGPEWMHAKITNLAT